MMSNFSITILVFSDNGWAHTSELSLQMHASSLTDVTADAEIRLNSCWSLMREVPKSHVLVYDAVT